MAAPGELGSDLVFEKPRQPEHGDFACSIALQVAKRLKRNPRQLAEALTANALAALLRNRATGLFHISNRGACSWYDFAKAILELCECGDVIDPVSSSEFLSRARRPKNSALVTERRGLDLPAWKDALKAYLVERRYLRYSTG